MKRSGFLLVDEVPEEGPATAMGRLLGRAAGVLVSRPETNSVLSAITSSEFLLFSINIEDNTENKNHYSQLAALLPKYAHFTHLRVSILVIQ